MGHGGARMKVCVLGLWHLGTVTAACLAAAGNEVVGLDFDAETVRRLQTGRPPLFEPGLEDLVKNGLKERRLRFTTDIPGALEGVEIVWVAYDTPVDEQDRADVMFVVERVERLFPYLPTGALVLISSQLPVGSTRRLERGYASAYSNKPVTFCYSPENLRLGKAISVFTRPDRVVVGIPADMDTTRVSALLRPFTERIEYMSIESAEMTKHALNAFLAVSVTFANEVATLCEKVGADAKEVERGLKSEARIGPQAYLSPGSAFSGGTLARDISFLTEIGMRNGDPTPLLSAVRVSNDAHKHWVRRKLKLLLGGFNEKRITVWGLTYKPGTDTLRRSISVELCSWLAEQGARVQAHDPSAESLPDDLAAKVTLHRTPLAALEQSAALVVATEWPEYLALTADAVAKAMSMPVVIDPNRFLVKTLGHDPRVAYFAVGSPAALQNKESA